MYLIADTTNGVQIVDTLENVVILDEDLFYNMLDELDDNEIIATRASLKMAKKIHKEYGINR